MVDNNIGQTLKKMAKSARSRLQVIYNLLTAGTEDMHDVSQSGQSVPLRRVELGTSRIRIIIFTVQSSHVTNKFSRMPVSYFN